MQCNFEIKVKKPEKDEIPFRPYVKFRLIHLNFSLNCMNDEEIDDQVDELIRKAEELRKKAKKDLKDAQIIHDKLLKNRS